MWEEELLQLQHEWALGLAGDDSGDNGDSEDSNAEGHYANDYPDEEVGSSDEGGDDGCSTYNGGGGSDALSDPEQQEGDGLRGDGGGAVSGGGFGVYRPGHRGDQRQGASRVVPAGGGGGGAGGVLHGGGGPDSDGSYDVDEYVTSEEEREGAAEAGDEEFGPAWLRKHCVGYGDAAAGGGDGGDGGQVWRSVLAQQFGPH